MFGGLPPLPRALLGGRLGRRQRSPRQSRRLGGARRSRLRGGVCGPGTGGWLKAAHTSPVRTPLARRPPARHQRRTSLSKLPLRLACASLLESVCRRLMAAVGRISGGTPERPRSGPDRLHRDSIFQHGRSERGSLLIVSLHLGVAEALPICLNTAVIPLQVPTPSWFVSQL